ncbi:hypothetical protein, partial [Leptospira santarosai]|uniref:hypothetical protein n=1 Tax=Leptospira santarosai TaxID=28183 RepID=UPI0024AF905F
FPSLHAKLDVFLIKKYLIVLSSSALRYPFTGLLLRFQSPEPDLVEINHFLSRTHFIQSLFLLAHQ